MTFLGDHFRQLRLTHGLTLAQTAKLLGYRNTAKGCRRVSTLEDRGRAHPILLAKLGNLLGVSAATIDELAKQDYDDFVQRWNAWADQPIEPYTVIKLIPAVYMQRPVPRRVRTREAAEKWATGLARKWNKTVCLVWTRRSSTWIEPNGSCRQTTATHGRRQQPSMQLAGGKIKFLFDETFTPREIPREPSE